MTAKIRIDPGKYSGVFWIRDLDIDRLVAGPFTGCGAVKEVDLSGRRFTVHISHGADFRFDVDAQGGVVSYTKGLVGGVGTLRFETVGIEIVPRQYRGTYAVTSVDDRELSGPRTITVLRGLVSVERDGGYIFYIAPSNAFRFNVGDDGKVSLNKHHAAVAERDGGHALKLNTCEIKVEPVNYTGGWIVRGVETIRYTPGVRTVRVIPGIDSDLKDGGYILEVAPGANTRFGVTGDGTPFPASREITQTPSIWHFNLLK